jgi:hypothetical protein
VLVLPVSDYYKGGLSPVTAVVVEGYDRAAPRGVGNVKVCNPHVYLTPLHVYLTPSMLKMCIQPPLYAQCVYLTPSMNIFNPL